MKSKLAEIFSRQTTSFSVTTILVRVIYVWFGRATLMFLGQFDNYVKVSPTAYSWPLFWSRFFKGPDVLNFISIFSMISFLLVMVRPGWRSARILAAYLFLCQLNVDYVWGDVGHASHAYFWILFVLALAPTWQLHESSREIRQRVLLNFFFAQTCLAFFYFLSGFAKLLSAFIQLANGQYSTFHLTGMSRIISARLLLGNTETLVGDLLINNPVLGFLGFWGTVLVELIGLWAVFRPAWHRYWGFAMVFFHLVVAISLSPIFINNLFLIFVMFVLSPFAMKESGYYAWDLKLWARSKKGFQRKS